MINLVIWYFVGFLVTVSFMTVIETADRYSTGKINFSFIFKGAALWPLTYAVFIGAVIGGLIKNR